MTLELPEDFLKRTANVYGERTSDVLELLVSFRAEYPTIATDRVLRCIVQAANGEASRIQKYIDLAKADWRDVITAGEYQYPDLHLRDLSKPFDH